MPHSGQGTFVTSINVCVCALTHFTIIYALFLLDLLKDFWHNQTFHTCLEHIMIFTMFCSTGSFFYLNIFHFAITKYYFVVVMLCSCSSRYFGKLSHHSTRNLCGIYIIIVSSIYVLAQKSSTMKSKLNADILALFVIRNLWWSFFLNFKN